jgi:hypothetical protein
MQERQISHRRIPRARVSGITILSHDINLPLDIRDKYIKPSGIYVKKKSKVLYERNHTLPDTRHIQGLDEKDNFVYGEGASGRPPPRRQPRSIGEEGVQNTSHID